MAGSAPIDFHVVQWALSKNLGGGFKYFLCSPLPGEGFQFDSHIFQMGWFNHQLGMIFASQNNRTGGPNST